MEPFLPRSPMLSESSVIVDDHLKNARSCVAAMSLYPRYNKSGDRSDGLVHPPGGLGHSMPLKVMNLQSGPLRLGQPGQDFGQNEQLLGTFGPLAGCDSSRANHDSSRADDSSMELLPAIGLAPAHGDRTGARPGQAST